MMWDDYDRSGPLSDLVFVELNAPDSDGVDGYDTAYQNQVIAADARTGRLLDAALSTSSGEEWLVVLTSNHGGGDGKIPLVVASNSPRVDVGRMPMDDPGSQMDVLPTIMHFLGGPSAVPRGLDGKVFGFRDYNRSATHAPTTTPTKVTPNPTKKPTLVPTNVPTSLPTNVSPKVSELQWPAANCPPQTLFVPPSSQASA